MSLSVSTMRAMVRKPIGVESDDAGWADADIDLLLNISLWEITDMFDFRNKESTTTIVTIAGTRDYDMPVPYEALQILSILDPDTNKHEPLKRVSEYQYEREYDEDSTTQAQPENFYRRAGTIRLWPTPDDIYTLTMYYLTTVTDLSNSNTASGLPQNWDEIVVEGAIYRGFKNLGDYIRSGAVRKGQMEMLSMRTSTKAKEAPDPQAGLRIAGYNRRVPGGTPASGRFNKF